MKTTHGLSWDENYGAGGVRDGANITFDVPSNDLEVVFSYELATHVLTVTTRAAGATPDLTKAKAQWVRRGLVAWDVPDADTRSYRLHWSRDGDLAVDAEAVTGGSSVPLTYDPSGLPDDVLADFPQLVGYEAFRLRRTDLRKVPRHPAGAARRRVVLSERVASRRHRRADPGRARRRVRRRHPARHWESRGSTASRR